MMASRYITLAGPSEWAVVNSLWAAMEYYDVRPDEVFILHEPSVHKTASKAADLVEGLLRGYGLGPRVKALEFQKDDFISVGKTVADLVRDGKEKGTVSVDITPGRKRYAVATLLAADAQGVDHVFYLYLENLWYGERPYPMIPHILHQIDDLKEVQSHG
jgi:hypothetical protein